MAEKILNRLIICVDGSEYDENGTLGERDPINKLIASAMLIVQASPTPATSSDSKD